MSEAETTRRVLLPTSVRDAVVAQVAAERDVAATEILSTGRRRPVAHARQLAMWRLRQITLNGQPAYGWISIGRAFGRDHTTAMFACRKVVKRGDHLT